MEGRSLLRSLVVGAAAIGSGCVGAVLPTEDVASVAAITTRYPTFQSYYRYEADVVEEPRESPVSYADLGPPAQFEAATSIVRHNYVTDEEPALGQSFVRFRGQTYDIAKSLAEFGSYDVGPENDPDWHDPVTL